MTPPETSQAAAVDLRGLLEKATPGPWAYRPNDYDDWGFIRGAETEWSIGTVRPIVAVSKDGGPDCDHGEHRRNKTDPYEPNGRLIVAAVNALPGLLDLLETLQRRVGELTDERDEAAEHLGQLLGADPGPKYAAVAKAARDWWLAYDRAHAAALDGKGPE